MKVLQFSGGLDSLACLELLKDTRGLTVVMATTDGAYPERRDYLNKLIAVHPHLEFVEVFGQRSLEEHGFPVDVVPLRYSYMGSLSMGSHLRYQPYFDCCNRALWQPLYETCLKLGATEIYRGQRDSDEHKAPISDGYEFEGIKYYFPIHTWSREQVIAFVEARCPELIPAYYAQEGSSRDCWDCTAYLKDNMVRIRNLPTAQFKIVQERLEQWREDVAQETRW